MAFDLLIKKINNENAKIRYKITPIGLNEKIFAEINLKTKTLKYFKNTEFDTPIALINLTEIDKNNIIKIPSIPNEYIIKATALLYRAFRDNNYPIDLSYISAG